MRPAKLADMTKTYERFDRDALTDLQARGLKHLTGANFFRTDNPDHPDNVAALAAADEYMKHFTSGESTAMGRQCICCGRTLTGFLGAFEWGLAYGEGNCGGCGYPGRAIHRIDGVGTVSNVVLQYHPDELSFNKPAE